MGQCYIIVEQLLWSRWVLSTGSASGEQIDAQLEVMQIVRVSRVGVVEAVVDLVAARDKDLH